MFISQLRDLLIQGVLLSFQRIHHLHKFFNCRHLYRRSRELQFSHFASLERIRWFSSLWRIQDDSLYCGCVNTLLRTYWSVTSFPTHVFNTRLPNQVPLTILVYKRSSANHEVFSSHMNWVLSQNSCSRCVCRRATQLKLEGVESNKHNFGL